MKGCTMAALIIHSHTMVQCTRGIHLCTTSVPILIHQYFNYSSLALGQGFSFRLVNSYLNLYTHGASSLVCRSPSKFLLLAVNRSSRFVFDCLQYAQTEREGQGLTYGFLNTWSAAHMTSQVLDTKIYSHLYLQLQRSWYLHLKHNRWRMIPLQLLQIQKRFLFHYAS